MPRAILAPPNGVYFRGNGIWETPASLAHTIGALNQMVGEGCGEGAKDDKNVETANDDDLSDYCDGDIYLFDIVDLLPEYRNALS